MDYTEQANRIDQHERILREGTPFQGPEGVSHLAEYVRPELEAEWRKRRNRDGTCWDKVKAEIAADKWLHEQQALDGIMLVVPQERLSEADINRMNAIDEERYTEGHLPRPNIDRDL